MNARKLSSLVSGIAVIIVISFSIYKLTVGTHVGFNEVTTIGALLIIFFSSMTWGSKHDRDGILQEEELGQRITEKSSKLSYFLLTFSILGAVALDKLLHDTVNVLLLALLGVSIILLPIVEFVQARKYQ